MILTLAFIVLINQPPTDSVVIYLDETTDVIEEAQNPIQITGPN